MSIASELTTLNTTKQNIKSAIEAKGVSLSGIPFTNYHAKIAEIEGGGSVPSDGYVRPSDWLPLPIMSMGEQKVAILVAIYDNDSNIARLRFTGAVTIDWGDGYVENVASSTQIDHTYIYSSISNDTLCSRGYKQAVIIVTPQNGQKLTVINTTNGITTGRYKPFLDIRMCGQYFNTFNFNYCFSLEQFEFIGDCAVTSLSSGFYACYNLENFISLKASSCTSFYQMFYDCTALKYVSGLTTSIGTDFSSMFNGCKSLRKVELFDTSNGTEFAAMFAGCKALKTIPLFDSSKVTTVNSMFESCDTLQSIPALNLANVTNAGNFVSYSNCISRILITGIKISFSISACFLSVNALVELFTNLPTVTSATITITNNLGAAALTAEQKAIATDKGWTITD